MFLHSDKQPGVKLTLKEHRWVQVVFRTLKTYHHVNVVFTQLSPINYEKVMKYEGKKMMSILFFRDVKY